VESKNVKIHTVLTKPNNLETPILAIIIAGSGPTDLNGNQPNLKNNSLLYLSNALVDNNIATVRFDKRGIAKSSYLGFNESGLKIELYADDVNVLINHFKSKGFRKIYLIGHSEGSLIGLISAQKSNPEGFISLCGAGNSADILLKKQLKSKLPTAFFNQVELIIDSLKNGQLVNSVPTQLNSLFRPSVQPYLISWFKYSPTYLLKDLTCPTLIIQGEKDLQIDVQEAEILAKSTLNGNFVLIKDMNHVLKTISGDIQENVASYTNPDLPLNEEIVKNIVAFIK
jgi:pimeloyl-ACP methyl ester carboxylesterase